MFVLIPKTPTSSYSLTSSDTNSLILVAKPIQIGSTPDAKGSNVPIKPIFDPFTCGFNMLSTLFELIPEGLFKFKNP